MTRIQLAIVVFCAIVGFSSLGIAKQVKSIMDYVPMVEPVVRANETRGQFIERINREDLNSIYHSKYYSSPLPPTQ